MYTTLNIGCDKQQNIFLFVKALIIRIFREFDNIWNKARFFTEAFQVSGFLSARVRFSAEVNGGVRALKWTLWEGGESLI